MYFYTSILIFLYILIFVTFVYGFFFSNSESEGINGYISRVLFQNVPNYSFKLLHLIVGDTISQYLLDWYYYFVYRRNPVCQLTYLLILNGAYVGWLQYGQPKLPTLFISDIHSYIAFLGILICHTSFYLACTIPPGHIRADNIRKYMHDSYDGILYREGRCVIIYTYIHTYIRIYITYNFL